MSWGKSFHSSWLRRKEGRGEEIEITMDCAKQQEATATEGIIATQPSFGVTQAHFENLVFS
jgi:hypothetical protein